MATDKGLDVLTVTERGEGAQKKNWWTKIGRAFPDKSGEGFTVVLDALPLPGVGGSCRLFLKPHKDQAELAKDRPHAPGEGGVVAAQQGGGADDIPF